MHAHVQQDGEQHVAFLPKQRPTAGKALAAVAVSVVIGLLPSPSTSWPSRVFKITQGANRLLAESSAVLLTRTGAAPSASKSQENSLKKCAGAGKGWCERHLHPARRPGQAAPKGSAGTTSSA